MRFAGINDATLCVARWLNPAHHERHVTAGAIRVVAKLGDHHEVLARMVRLREMLIEVHRVVQKPDDLDRSGTVDPKEHDVPRVSTGLLDVVAEDARAGASDLAATRVGSDGIEGFVDEGPVLLSLSLAPAIHRVPEDIRDIAPR